MNKVFEYGFTITQNEFDPNKVKCQVDANLGLEHLVTSPSNNIPCIGTRLAFIGGELTKKKKLDSTFYGFYYQLRLLGINNYK